MNQENTQKNDDKIGRPRKISESQLINAIAGSGGLRKLIADELEISLRSLDRYIDRYPEAKQALENERNERLGHYISIAHDNLYEALKGGDWAATKYVLLNYCKDEFLTDKEPIRVVMIARENNNRIKAGDE